MAASNFKFGQSVGAQLERHRLPKSPIGFEGHFNLEQWRDGKLFKTYKLKNGVVNQGKNAILDSYFRNQAPPALWYLGLIDNAGFTALDDANDTALSHTGWAEATGYTEANRPTWVTTAAASQSITNPTPATFTINATQTLKGIFAITDNVKSGTSGVLWATALFAGNIPVANLDILKITYSVNAT